jgi:hypothetical protein
MSLPINPVRFREKKEMVEERRTKIEAPTAHPAVAFKAVFVLRSSFLDPNLPRERGIA